VFAVSPHCFEQGDAGMTSFAQKWIQNDPQTRLSMGLDVFRLKVSMHGKRGSSDRDFSAALKGKDFEGVRAIFLVWLD
jgi:hypothetical protein